jgi:hypothetical protein
MTDADVLADAITALGQAAERKQPISFGSDVARVLHAALLDTTDPVSHEHAWQPLGWDRPAGGTARVIQACACGMARELVADSEEPMA